MLFRLGHDAFVGGDDEQHHVHFGCPCQHVVNEPLVPWHIHDARNDAAGQSQMGETQVNGHTALTLFGVPIGFNARQRPNQRRLAVVYMPSRPDDDVLALRHRPSPMKVWRAR